MGVYLGLALVFGGGVLAFGGAEMGLEYFAGYVTEKALSVNDERRTTIAGDTLLSCGQTILTGPGPTPVGSRRTPVSTWAQIVRSRPRKAAGSSVSRGPRLCCDSRLAPRPAQCIRRRRRLR